jgi:hypothetical protein
MTNIIQINIDLLIDDRNLLPYPTGEADEASPLFPS